MSTLSEKLLNIIDERVKKVINNMGIVQKYVGIVTNVSVDNKTITVVIAGYDTEFTFLNKSGEKISIGEGVKIECDSSGLSGAYISERFGTSELNNFFSSIQISSDNNLSFNQLKASGNLALIESYASNYNSRRQLQLGNNNITLANALKLATTTDGSNWSTYNLFGEHNFPYVIGSYTGTYSTVNPQTINLGFTPRRVLVGQVGGSYFYGDGQNSVVLVANGFTVTGTISNNTGVGYSYIAFK